MKKQIKITATLIDKSKREFLVTSFEVFPVQREFAINESKTLYVELDNHYTFICLSVKVEQIS